MKKDAYDKAREYLRRDVVINVINWALENNLVAVHYDPTSDLFAFNDGEIYTTRRILRELEA